jgi:hypothetical protein
LGYSSTDTGDCENLTFRVSLLGVTSASASNADLRGGVCRHSSN